MTFTFSKGESNRHGGQVQGNEKKGEMIRGWKIAYIKLKRESPGFGHRFILYFPNGACWYFDFYSKLKKQLKIS